MRCREHSSDHSGGVCPRCLRDRLSSLAAAEAEQEGRRSPEILSSHTDSPNVSDDQKRRAHKLSLFSPIRVKQTPKKTESDAIVLKPSISHSGFLSLIMKQWSKNRKKLQGISPAEEYDSRGRSRKPHLQPVNGRGMSPAMKEEREGDRRRISAPSPLRQKAQRQQSPNRFSSYVVCLSPMLRPSPGNRRNHGPSDTVIAGDVHGSLNRKWSGVGVAFPEASSGLGMNRSRKLVDLGPRRNKGHKVKAAGRGIETATCV
ncbi:uncharacterized protein LOC110022822 [Phalaenopsis equestris]|uniref:uncharacterized protein LOC110022822 n=1 Tax=Phalaenopsis equestris TaxID=78828 RepID=UPI0009E59A0B|nr:uncharacterized protein LOC110022822 [Phalaenopsis equestris]